MKRQQIDRLTDSQIKKLSREDRAKLVQDWQAEQFPGKVSRINFEEDEAVRKERIPVAEEELKAVMLEIEELNEEGNQIIAEQQLVRAGEGNINPRQLKEWRMKYHGKVQDAVARQRKLEAEIAALKGLPSPDTIDLETEAKEFNAQTDREETPKLPKKETQDSYEQYSKKRKAKEIEQEQDDLDDEIEI